MVSSCRNSGTLFQELRYPFAGTAVQFRQDSSVTSKEYSAIVSDIIASVNEIIDDASFIRSSLIPPETSEYLSGNKGACYSAFLKSISAFILISIALLCVVTITQNSAFKDQYKEAMSVYDEEFSTYWKHKTAVEKYQKTGLVPVIIDISVEETGNESIGNELEHLLKINNSEFYLSGSYDSIDTIEMRMNTKKKNTFYLRTIDQETLPDVGSTSYSCDFTASELKDGCWVELYNYVSENRGPSAGNTAEFTAIIDIRAKSWFVTKVDELDQPIKPELTKYNIIDTFNHILWVKIFIAVLLICCVAYIVYVKMKIKKQ